MSGLAGDRGVSLFVVGTWRGVSEYPLLSPGSDSGPALSRGMGTGGGKMLERGVESQGG